MIGSIYVGLSGLAASSQGLRTISANVANLNAPGFKATDFRFTEVENLSKGSAGLGSAHGVRFGEVRVDFGQGELRPSSGDFDLAIDGEGFLVLLAGEKSYYARTAEFVIDEKGFLAERLSGHRLGLFDENGRTEPFNLEEWRTSPPVATSRVTFAGNLSSSATQASIPGVTVFAPNGASAVWTIAIGPAEPAVPGEWQVNVTRGDGTEIGGGVLRFSGSAVDPDTAEIAIADGTGEERFEVVLDFEETTSFPSGSTSTLRDEDVDGSAEGALTSIRVAEDGSLELGYSNGKTETLAKVALAGFADPQRLKQIGGGLFDDTGAGEIRLGASSTQGLGRLVSGQIESSNVDLADEFGDLILVQRGFQASSQVVTVTNEMIEQLFSIGSSR